VGRDGMSSHPAWKPSEQRDNMEAWQGTDTLHRNGPEPVSREITQRDRAQHLQSAQQDHRPVSRGTMQRDGTQLTYCAGTAKNHHEPVSRAITGREGVGLTYCTGTAENHHKPVSGGTTQRERAWHSQTVHVWPKTGEWRDDTERGCRTHSLRYSGEPMSERTMQGEMAWTHILHRDPVSRGTTRSEGTRLTLCTGMAQNW
jgi:hypothetical protein